MTEPTADDIARAVTFACMETGENPVDVIMVPWKLVDGKAPSHFQARFYAYHALHLEFPQTCIDGLAKALGVSIGVGKTFSFTNSARYNVLQRGHYDLAPKASWFDFEKLERVRNGVRAGRGLEPLTKQFWPHILGVEPPPSNRQTPRRQREQSAQSLPPAIIKRPPPPEVVGESLMLGDPSPERAALHTTKPWKPYEQRCAEEGLYDDKPRGADQRKNHRSAE